MTSLEWSVEVEAEVEEWLTGLADRDFRIAAAAVDLLGEPWGGPAHAAVAQLGRGLRELRFDCEGVARRITYWIDSERRISLLTTFRKQRDNERREVTRARAAMTRCIQQRHTADGDEEER